VLEGIEYPADNDGRSFTSTFGEGVRIAKGASVDFYVLGDILPGAINRTIKFDIRESGDIWLTGATYGFTDYVYAGGNTDVAGSSVFITSDGTTDGDEGIPFFSGSTFTIYGTMVNGVGRN
jgi:hypothetical protein